MTARIYKPSRSAMQSGTAKYDRWVLEHDASAPREIEPLMGWTSSRDTLTQVKLWFDTLDEAVAFATRNGIPYRVDEPEPSARRQISYSDNFRFDRLGPWTH